MNKRYLQFILIYFIFCSPIIGQEDEQYELVTNIPYYSTSSSLDKYQSERCVLDIYYPTHIDSFATVIWFHGGGLRAGEKFIPEILNRKNIAVVAANYRLYPSVKSPVYIEDAAAATAWVFQNISKYGGDPQKIFVSGHSAGGYLASMIGLDQSYLEVYGVNANDIAGLIPFSGHAITHFTVREEQGMDGKTVVVDHLAPITHIRNDAPPYTIITGDRQLELLGRYEENAYMWRMMQEVDHPDCTLYELDGFNHGEMFRPALYILLKEINRIIKK